ncbi:MAG TPA: adenine deaminase [Bacteroidetes bacterium]|nr:adenine deaminase [Bacteroidota bacterium]
MLHQLEQIIRVARNEILGDLLIKNARIVNVYSGEIIEADVVTSGEMIAGIGKGYQAKEVIDLKGAYLAPGFIDGHVHIESSMVDVPEFARAVVPLGTTSVIADPHEIANVLGYEGIRYMLDASKFNPLNVFFMMPSCVPATKLETSGSSLRAFEIYPLLREKWVLGLGEVMNFPGVLERDENLLDKIQIASDKRIDGHAPGLTGYDLNAYIATGIGSDHECTQVEEAREKLRLGMYIMIREGTFIKNLRDLLPLVTPENSRRCCFCTDDRHPHDILEEGHINFMIKTAIEYGIDPVTAIRMATLNTAEYFGLRQRGGIKPGNYADMVSFNNFEDFHIRHVFRSGKLVALDGEAIIEPPIRPEATIRSTMNIKWLQGDEFVIPAEGKRARIIGLIEDQALTEEIIDEVKVRDGKLVSDPDRDILRAFVLERHNATGNIGKGLVRGLGLKRGAIASSVAHDSHNVIVAGNSDEEIMRAVIQINKMGGGIAVVDGDRVLEALELPIAGLMSRLPLEEVSKRTERLVAATHRLGCKVKDPLMALSFMSLAVIPKLKLTDLGLVDVEKQQFVPLFVDGE